MKNFKLFMLPTQNAGLIYWRMYNYARNMANLGFADVALYDYDITDDMYNRPWQTNIQFEPNHLAMDDINKLHYESNISVVQTLHSTYAVAFLKALKNAYPEKKLFMEIDDYLFNPPHYNPGAESYKPDSEVEKVAREQLSTSDGVIVTTEYLRDLYKPYNSNIHIIPNCIDFDFWNVRNRTRENEIRVGWVGGGSHREDLKIIAPALEEVHDRCPDVKFVFPYGCPSFLKDRPNVLSYHRFVNIACYPRYLARFGFDIGLAPLVDNSFNRAKSNLRWLEYSALKIPTIASPVEPFAKCIRDGENGFLAANKKEWVEKIVMLVNEKKLRNSIAEAAHEDIRKNYNSRYISKDYAELMKKECRYDFN